MKGKKCSAEHCANLSKAKMGKKHSEETRAKISKGRKRTKLSEEHYVITAA